MNLEISQQKLVGHSRRAVVFVLALFVALAANHVQAQTEAAQEVDATTEQRHKEFAELLSGSKFVGSFTVLGQKNQKLSAEEYHIKSAKKLDDGTKWQLVARIKYGSYDLSVPITLDVIWAGDTPVITLTDVKVPFMGSFSSRVVVYKGKYSGTWSHGEVGGHLFGTIERDKAEGVDVEKTQKEMDEKKEKDAEKKKEGSEKKSEGSGSK